MTEQQRIPSLSETEAVILSLISSVSTEPYGLELVKMSEGRLKRGTVYVTLQRMEEKGFIESRQETSTDEQIGIPRRVYRMTGLGQKALAAREMLGAFLAGGAV